MLLLFKNQRVYMFQRLKRKVIHCKQIMHQHLCQKNFCQGRSVI